MSYASVFFISTLISAATKFAYQFLFYTDKSNPIPKVIPNKPLILLLPSRNQVLMNHIIPNSMTKFFLYKQSDMLNALKQRRSETKIREPTDLEWCEKKQ